VRSGRYEGLCSTSCRHSLLTRPMLQSCFVASWVPGVPRQFTVCVGVTGARGGRQKAESAIPTPHPVHADLRVSRS
jgi:hypothetical protein